CEISVRILRRRYCAIRSLVWITDCIVAYIEAAQQEFVEKARETADDIWDLGTMWAKNVLIKGREVLEHEVK
ncbi:TPA: hypothetical protein ACULEP_003848, partial [Escherichia coli]